MYRLGGGIITAVVMLKFKLLRLGYGSVTDADLRVSGFCRRN